MIFYFIYLFERGTARKNMSRAGGAEGVGEANSLLSRGQGALHPRILGSRLKLALKIDV